MKYEVSCDWRFQPPQIKQEGLQLAEASCRDVRKLMEIDICRDFDSKNQELSNTKGDAHEIPSLGYFGSSHPGATCTVPGIWWMSVCSPLPSTQKMAI